LKDLKNITYKQFVKFESMRRSVFKLNLYVMNKRLLLFFALALLEFCSKSQNVVWPAESIKEAKLFWIIHDYFTKTLGLTNLIWIWDMQDMSRDFEEYDPGDEYWDVFGFDIYDQGYDSSWYKYILSIIGDKPMAIGECSKLPSSDILNSQPRWVFFMPWAV